MEERVTDKNCSVTVLKRPVEFIRLLRIFAVFLKLFFKTTYERQAMNRGVALREGARSLPENSENQFLI